MTLDAPFDELKEGTRFDTRGRTITESDVVAFAAQTGDWHPQHTDAVWAASSRFGERIAHGLLVLSYGVGLLPFDPERVVALRRVGDAVFKRPVCVGDTIRVRGSIESCAPIDDGAGLVAIGLRIVNQHDAVVVRARVDVVWRRDDALAGIEAAPANGFVPIPL